jgi:type II secretory pathway pseudopilin PulG
MKESKGISLVVLIITIIILIILSALLINTGNLGLQRAEEAKIKNEISTIKEAVTKRFTYYIENEIRYPLIGEIVDINEANSDFGRDVTDEIEYIRKLDSAYTQMLNIERIDSNHIYIVNYNSGEVVGPLKSTQ